jgi:hypothetical protein
MDNKRLVQPCLMGLVYLLAGQAAIAMPVTHALDHDGPQRGSDFVQLSQSPEQPLKPLQALQPDVGVAMIANSPLLVELAKQPGAEFEAALAMERPAAASAALQGSGLRPSSRAEQELFDGGGAKDLLIPTEVKTVLKELRSELHRLTGDHFVRAQAASADEQAKLARRLDEAKSSRDEATGWRPSVSDEERRQGAWRVALMTEQMLDEIRPWAITAAVLYGLFYAARALMRKQALARLQRGRAKGSALRPATLPAEPLHAEGPQVRVRQRVRLTSASSSRSRRKLF